MFLTQNKNAPLVWKEALLEKMIPVDTNLATLHLLSKYGRQGCFHSYLIGHLTMAEL
jgi:hypothetical protein